MNNNIIKILISWRNRVSLINFYQDALNKKCKINIKKMHPNYTYEIETCNRNIHLYHTYIIDPTGVTICQVSATQ